MADVGGGGGSGGGRRADAGRGGSVGGGGGGGRDDGGRGVGVVAALYLESMASAVHGETRVFVMAVTANPLRMYLFMGGPTLEVRCFIWWDTAWGRRVLGVVAVVVVVGMMVMVMVVVKRMRLGVVVEVVVVVVGGVALVMVRACANGPITAQSRPD